MPPGEILDTPLPPPHQACTRTGPVFTSYSLQHAAAIVAE